MGVIRLSEGGGGGLVWKIMDRILHVCISTLTFSVHV